MQMAAIPMALMAAGTIVSIAGSMKQGQYAEDAARSQQEQLNYEAGQSEAAGQRRAIAEREQAQMLISRARAVSSASGGGSLDPALFAGLFDVGEENAMNAMYSAREQAAGLRYKGEMGIMQAQQASQVGKMQAIGQGLQGLGSMGMMASKSGWLSPGGIEPGSGAPQGSTLPSRTPTAIGMKYGGGLS
jgi:hypothetical protein